MIIVKLQGGLGNQMFQYAAARALAVNRRVQLDLSFLEQNHSDTNSFTARTYELNIFRNLKASDRYQWFIKLITGKARKLGLFKTLMPHRFKDLIHVNDDNFKNELPSDRSIYLDGYFQDHTYFEPIRAALLKEFEFPKLSSSVKKLLNDIISCERSVSLHVRRGDYLKPEVAEFHGVLDVEYYENAVNLMSKVHPQATYFIFSEDRAWCEQHLKFIDKCHFIQGGDQAWVDMYLMTKCKHHIIANSSFSWWGAWLADHRPDQTVIAPKRWFKNADTASNARIPAGWIKL